MIAQNHENIDFRKDEDFAISLWAYLPEYQKTAYLNFKDAAGTRRLKRIKRKIQVNKEYPFTISLVDEKLEENGFITYNIDLTKKYQTPDEEENFIKKYRK